MQVKIFINDQLYKTVAITDESYDPNSFWPAIEADLKSGALASFGVDTGMAIRYEKSL